VLAYELLTGASPFTVEGEKNVPADISKRILKSQPPIPRSFSKHTRDFILKLLVKQPSRRLGAHGAQEVKSHAFFESISWDDLVKKKLPPPFKPHIRNELDTNNFADEFTRQAPTDSPAIVPAAPNCENLFRGYSYVAPSILFSSNVLTTGTDLSNSGGNTVANATPTCSAATQSTTSNCCNGAASNSNSLAIDSSSSNSSFSTSVNSWLKVCPLFQFETFFIYDCYLYAFFSF
jgi:serine/threonine protein kinase